MGNPGGESNIYEATKRNLLGRTILLAVAWTCLLGFALWQTHIHREEQAGRYAVAQARGHFNTENILHSRDPELDYLVGRGLTRIQRNGLTEQSGAYAPDDWEAAALASFQSGTSEVTEFQVIEGDEYFRWMGPVYEDRACHSCHTWESGAASTLRGGVSILMPMKSLLAVSVGSWRRQVVTHFAVWISGLLALAWGSGSLIRVGMERSRIAHQMEAGLEATQTIVENVPFGMVIVGKDRRIRLVNKVAETILEETSEELVGSPCHRNFCPAAENACPIMDLDQRMDNSARWVLGANGIRIPVHKSVLPIVWKGEEVLLEAFVDMSEHQQALTDVKGLLAEEQRLNRLATGRELRMIQLKREVNELAAAQSEAPRYRESESTTAANGSVEVTS
jgi:PAS domain S-box-containing protein